MFGSSLKGTARSDSDVDLSVEFEPEAKPSPFTIAKIEVEARREEGRFVHDARFKSRLPG